MSNVVNLFKDARKDPAWSFEGERSHNLLTHGYHKYPAKFVPQLVGKILDNYSLNKEDLICDPFAGCGTTLVEAKVRGLRSIGVDVNPVAQLITKAKTQPIEPNELDESIDRVRRKIQSYINGRPYPKHLKYPAHKRLDYWFDEKSKLDIALLFRIVEQEKNKKHILFLQCAISNILKDTSRWLQSSTKPQVDPNKKPRPALERFLQHLNTMVRKNREFYELLQKSNYLRIKSEIKLADARDTKIKSNSVSMVITSPPYVTSYEYADIHQLSGYWFEYIDNLPTFRKKFIGSAFTDLEEESEIRLSLIGSETLKKLEKRDKKTAREVASYFSDMYYVAKEISRILKKGGTVCIVIGNTTLKNVYIPNAEVFAEMLTEFDLTMKKIIKRSIPHKLIPTIRDKTTGRFTKKTSRNSKRVYPEEYILILKK